MLCENMEKFKSSVLENKLADAEQILPKLEADINRMRPEKKADFHYYLGRYYCERQAWEKAEEAFKAIYNESFRKDECYNHTRALHAMGKMSYRRGNYEAAIGYYRRVLNIWNSHEEDYFSTLGINYLGQARCFEALGERDTALIYYRLARTYAITGEDKDLEEKSGSELDRLLKAEA